MANEPQASVLSHLARAISNVEPSLEVRKKKIAGITRQIPCTVPKARGERLAIRWIITSARERVRRRGKGLSSCLAEELIDAYYKRGEPRQRRDSLHKAAESNRSFLRYRWW
uniref:Ribosomal protein S7 n=1 Tax=Coccomyxa subellipsoidea (strain C-169) TaxID=574566 RepID=F1DPL5_COCSC|nr:ribosomal protein S7 [Coccomyxa subellipsoidea C-169]ADY75455.1 ribosomal protein S7 [Coccomyxa subellipsoidea C-169]